jgi:predicted dithiol-disulfide oxidoreductase (DUF899 family)
MSLPRVVSAAKWVAARKELQAAEEEAVRTLEQIASRRREMPAVKIEKDYVFEGPGGQASLLDLFEGRTQLIVQHFMFDPAWDEGCPVCSYQADSVGDLAHLHARNTSYAAVSRAPISKIEPFRQRMGWTFPWYSSQGSDFNYDFHVTLDESVTPIEYNFRTAQELTDIGQARTARPGEQGAVSVFFRDGDTYCIPGQATAQSPTCSARPTSSSTSRRWAARTKTSNCAITTSTLAPRPVSHDPARAASCQSAGLHPGG